MSKKQKTILSEISNVCSQGIRPLIELISRSIVSFFIITLLFLTPLLYHLPQATLAAVIITAVINLIKFSKHLGNLVNIWVISNIIIFVNFNSKCII